MRSLGGGFAVVIGLSVVAGCGGGSGAAGGGTGSGGSSAVGVTGGAGGSGGASAIGGTAGADTGTAGSSTDAGGHGGAGATGGAGQGAGGSAANGLTVTWTFPALIRMGTATTFPTYLAHLLGKPTTEAFPTDLACAKVVNTAATASTVHLSVALGIYGGMVPTDVNVLAQSSKTTCLIPALDKTALYKLTAPDSQQLDATARDATGADVGSIHMTLAIPPVGSRWSNQTPPSYE